MTTDLQRMRQDEWIAELVANNVPQTRSRLRYREMRCALGLAEDDSLASCSYEQRPPAKKVLLAIRHHLGISAAFANRVIDLNDRAKWLFPQIASYVKEQRDAHDGDLSHWGSPQ